MIRTALSALALIPTMALADCPTAADLDTGIRFKLADGDIEVFSRLNDSTVQSRFFIDGDVSTRVLLARGLYLTETIDVNGDQLDVSTRLTYAFPGNPGDLPLPVPGGQYTTEVVVNDQGRLNKETQIYRSGQETQVQFGQCAYRMIPVEIEYLPNDDGAKDSIHWFPDLGISYLAGIKFPDGEDRFTYISIEALE